MVEKHWTSPNDLGTILLWPRVRAGLGQTTSFDHDTPLIHTSWINEGCPKLEVGKLITIVDDCFDLVIFLANTLRILSDSAPFPWLLE